MEASSVYYNQPSQYASSITVPHFRAENLFSCFTEGQKIKFKKGGHFPEEIDRLDFSSLVNTKNFSPLTSYSQEVTNFVNSCKIKKRNVIMNAMNTCSYLFLKPGQIEMILKGIQDFDLRYNIPSYERMTGQFWAARQFILNCSASGQFCPKPLSEIDTELWYLNLGYKQLKRRKKAYELIKLYGIPQVRTQTTRQHKTKRLKTQANTTTNQTQQPLSHSYQQIVPAINLQKELLDQCSKRVLRQNDQEKSSPKKRTFTEVTKPVAKNDQVTEEEVDLLLECTQKFHSTQK